MLIYKRYILQVIVPSFFYIASVLTAIVLISKILKLLYLIDKGVKISHFLSLILFIIPSLLFVIMPVITVIAIVHAYNKLKEERQLLVLSCSGVGDGSLIKPALTAAFIITLFALSISTYFMPLSYNILTKRLDNLKDNYVSSAVDIRTFNQLSKDHTIYIDNKKNDGTFEGVVLFDNKNPVAKSVLFAKEGTIIMENNIVVFKLRNGLRHAYDSKGNMTKLTFEDMNVQIGNYHDTASDSKSQDNQVLYIYEMLKPDKNLDENSKLRLIAEGHQRIIWPLYNFILPFLAISILLKQPYTRKISVFAAAKTVIPVLIVTYIHFTLQKLSYDNNDFIFLCYANVFLCIIFSIWQNKHKII